MIITGRDYYISWSSRNLTISKMHTIHSRIIWINSLKSHLLLRRYP
nr:MAG TPA: hypothetical protein [Caudoviricetes sp.]DAM06024.1 MAG TPA: hypothetical protein [Caudoviricetes sp.]DAT61663.1 MAG TPA: hypothetical protein [Caudoviricetes sp.]